jgi:hypothetical protein
VNSSSLSARAISFPPYIDKIVDEIFLSYAPLSFSSWS